MSQSYFPPLPERLVPLDLLGELELLVDEPELLEGVVLLGEVEPLLLGAREGVGVVVLLGVDLDGLVVLGLELELLEGLVVLGLELLDGVVTLEGDVERAGRAEPELRRLVVVPLVLVEPLRFGLVRVGGVVLTFEPFELFVPRRGLFTTGRFVLLLPPLP
jgi:hypothetical protein